MLNKDLEFTYKISIMSCVPINNYHLNYLPLIFEKFQPKITLTISNQYPCTDFLYMTP